MTIPDTGTAADAPTSTQVGTPAGKGHGGLRRIVRATGYSLAGLRQRFGG